MEISVTTDSSVKLFPAWKELYHQAKVWEYGSFRSHREIAAILNLPIGTKYYAAVQRANQQLLTDHMKYLRNVVKKGYRVINPNEHLSESSRQIKVAGKRFKHGVAIASNTNRTMLSIDENQKLTDYLSRAGQLTTIVGERSKQLGRIAASSQAPKPGPLPKLKIKASSPLP